MTYNSNVKFLEFDVVQVTKNENLDIFNKHILIKLCEKLNGPSFIKTNWYEIFTSCNNDNSTAIEWVLVSNIDIVDIVDIVDCVD